MKKLLLFFAISSALFACGSNSNAGLEKAEDAQDAGRLFIRASLDGDYDRAMNYMLKDSMNVMILRKWKDENYDKLSNENKINYKNANILPIKIENVSDSIVSYAYTNTFKRNDTTVLFIIRSNGDWKVDLKKIHRY
ncbi:hypothetical protein [Pinibacter aurantiacus]|uniref:DUF4878 domain-containing protein n=1 Tax=Pinibacter aurantiacus TaxID=2851599 RepID=A0A9E2SBW8_9BACT|nr:hypothetical protein [Pinibacter aurantiacus]MBV4358492.1 hypothetical protein [Pinibacter aurantiacus]